MDSAASKEVRGSFALTLGNSGMAKMRLNVSL
jgi:hypothetical protein